MRKIQRGGDPMQQPAPSGKKRKVYTTGTLYEKETGRYQSEPWADDEKSRTGSHKKKAGTGTATVTRGARAKGAGRGVGQPTIDGFINGLERNRQKRKK